ncbi:MAG: VIT and VWA domain-containing protein [Truepera sp.]|nr:VIT and VWA domain-containing protein [Truepera sp.]
MRSILAATMESAQGQVVLEEVGIDAAVDDLMTVVSVRQRYRNPGTKHLEAVYTFPLPLEAVLLNFEVELGDRRMAGTVIAKPDAEARYEDAITDGDAAVLLEQAQPGLYTASVGNLAPGETATIRFRYGLLLRWNGDTVRLMMPTTIAPRYGDPSAGGLSPHQSPEFSFDAERSFHLQIAVRGVLHDARWSSPSHDIAVTPDGRQTVIEIARPAAMDRDFVLEARSTGTAGTRALLARDDGDWVVLASFRPEIPDLSEGAAHRSLKIVVDCSGSMGGDSIAQVRIAGERILDSLRPSDLFDIVAFGTGHRVLFDRETAASRTNVARARRFVRSLDANMGGTEIAAALRATYGIAGEPGMPHDLLLITDGEVWDTDGAVAEARASGHRIFTVGVGSSVAEPFVRALAQATGGACELVAPREGMAERIHRHFQRILAPPASSARVTWPAPVQRAVPDPLPPPYPGDTMHLFGSFAERPQGPVVLELELSDSHTITHRMEIDALPTDTADVERTSATRSDLARMGAAQRLPTIDDEAATEFAVRYQLLSEWTDYLVVHVRAEADKATELPSLVKVPQVIAAGWHGLGTVHEAPQEHVLSGTVESAPRFILEDLHKVDELVSDSRSAPITSLIEFVEALNAHPLPTVPTLDDLWARDLPDEIIEDLWELVESDDDSRTVAIIFLYLLRGSPAGSTLDRQQRRLILSAYKKLSPDAATVGAVRRVWQEWNPPGGGGLA